MTTERPIRPLSRARVIWAVVRLAAATLLTVALVAQVFATAAYAHAEGHDLTVDLTNHLSFFTVLSTAAGAVVLAIGGVWLAAHARSVATEPRWLSVLFLAFGAAVVITGIVYNVLLRGGGPDPDTIGWASEVKHVVAPIVFALDLILCIGRAPLTWRDALWALMFPLLWAGYTLLRGEFVTDQVTGNPWWYPYGFLDPHKSASGYLGVTLYIVGIAAALVLIALLAVWASRRRRSARQR